jgi:hypothetical protein
VASLNDWKGLCGGVELATRKREWESGPKRYAPKVRYQGCRIGSPNKTDSRDQIRPAQGRQKARKGEGAAPYTASVRGSAPKPEGRREIR